MNASDIRRWLFVLLAVVLVRTPAEGQGERHIRLIGTSDVHGNYFPYDFMGRKAGEGSLARVAAFVAGQRDSLGCDRVVTLDCGDILQGQPSAYYYNFIDTAATHVCAAALNLIGYDAGTVGNHDVETGHAVYDRRAGQCRFPLLGANVTDVRTGNPYWRPYALIERGGLRIAVLGLVTPSIPKWLPETLWKGLRFEDMTETARRWMPVLRDREKADIVVGLFHSGAGDPLAGGRLNEHASLQVAREVPGFDLIVCGHDHRETCRTVVNVAGDTVRVLNPGAGGMKVALADICVLPAQAGKCRKTVSGQLADIRPLTPDSAFCRQLDAAFRAVRSFTGERIGYNATPLSTRPAYFGPSAFVDFIHSLQLKISGADISFAAPLSFDAGIPAGDIRVSDMFNLYKYENLLYVMRMTGDEILRYLEFSYGRWTRRMSCAEDTMLNFRPDPASCDEPWQRLATPSYNFDSAAGLRYTVDLRKEEGKKITVLSLTDGRAFSPDSVYRVAVNSYRGNGGGDLLTRGAGIPKEELAGRILWSTEKDLRYYLMEEIRRQGRMAPRPRNEWKFIPGEWVEKTAVRDAKILFE